MTEEKAIEILQELWRYKETDKYTDSEIRLALDIAIQTLKNQPRFILHSDGKIEQIIESCDDAVSRQAVLDLIEHYNSDGLGAVFYGYEEGVKFANEVNKLPPVRPQQKTENWIPVSERLPEKSVWVLAYCKTKEGYEYQAVLLIGKYRGEWTDNDDFCDEVIAWRPLPEPYKAESEAAEI